MHAACSCCLRHADCLFGLCDGDAVYAQYTEHTGLCGQLGLIQEANIRSTQHVVRSNSMAPAAAFCESTLCLSCGEVCCCCAYALLFALSYSMLCSACKCWLGVHNMSCLDWP